MDPDLTLTSIREELVTHHLGRDADVARLVELVEALDEWLSTGGFLPAAWRPGRRDRS